MASYTITTAIGEVGAHGKVLVASTVDTVTFDDREDCVQVITDGTADVYVRTDGVNPTVNDPKAYRVPAGVRSQMLVPSQTVNPTQARLISVGTPTYSVQRCLGI